MAAVLLAVLGVPVWLVVGMLLGAFYSRHRYRQDPAVFRGNCRVIDGRVDALDDSWGRTPVYVRWVHDVLLITRGLALVRVLAIPVADLVDGPAPVGQDGLRRLGAAPVAVRLRTDDGATIELATAADDHENLLGPFVSSTPA